MVMMEIEFFATFHYLPGGVMVIQECPECFALVPYYGCPHHCPEIASSLREAEDLTYLKYILAGIGANRYLEVAAIAA